MRVENFMIKDFPAIYLHTKVDDVLEIAKTNRASFLPVMTTDHKPFGIIWNSSIIDSNGAVYAENLTEVSFMEVTEDKSISELMKINCDELKKPILVVDRDKTLKGFIPCYQWVEISKALNSFSRQIMDTLNKAIMIVDKHGYITYISHKWEDIHGLSKIEGEYVGNRFPESGLIEVINNKPPRDKNQSRIFFSSTGATVVPLYKPIKNNSGDITGAIAIVEDDSANNMFKFIAQNLNDLEDNISIIFNFLDEAIAVTNMNGELLYANNSYYDMVGEKDRNDLLNNLHSEFLKKNQEKDLYHGENIEIKMSNNYKYLNVSMIPIVNYVEEIQGVTYILRDVTQDVTLNKSLNKKDQLIKFFNQKILDKDDKIIAKSEQLSRLLKMVLKVSKSDASVLITGENGVGKELLAKTIHKSSNRKEKPFITVNCGAIPESLWESEMFGYEEGAFTGSKKGGKLGQFSLANKGTLFLDEISEMPLNSQVKLLRILQNMELQKVGAEKTDKIDVRIIAATNKNLKEMVNNGTFREDLYYRINVFQMDIPPLRERIEDIEPAINYFLEVFNDKYKKNVGIKQDTLDILINYHWPGNIRELRNVVEHGVIMAERNYVEPKHLPEVLNSQSRICHSSNGNTLKDVVKNAEREMIKKTLVETSYNKTLAMKKLNISRRTFYKKVKELSLSPDLLEKSE